MPIDHVGAIGEPRLSNPTIPRTTHLFSTELTYLPAVARGASIASSKVSFPQHSGCSGAQADSLNPDCPDLRTGSRRLNGGFVGESGRNRSDIQVPWGTAISQSLP